MASVSLPPDFREFLRLLNAHLDVLDGVEVNLIDLDHLKVNKRAAGRYKDPADLESLP